MCELSKEELIRKIRASFKGVTLEDGIGLWEAQGLDDYKTPEECKKLREKDERYDWNNVSVADLYQCYSSPSFFDAKGMRFHLPILLLHALNELEAEQEGLQGSPPDIEFHLTSMVLYLNNDSKNAKRMMEFQNMRFALLNKEQIECVILFLKYRLKEMKNYTGDFNDTETAKALEWWNEKLNTN